MMCIGSAKKKSQGGQAIVLFTLMVSSLLIPMVGLAIDGGRGYLVRLKLSSAVDGGALAAARLLGTGANAKAQLDNANSTAKQYVAANFPVGFFGANLTGAATVCVDPGTDTSDPCGVGNGKAVNTYKVRTVSVRAAAQMPTFFMRLLGMPTVTVQSAGLASRRDVRVVLAMDRSASMSSFYGSITDTNSINYKAWKFVNSFSGSSDLGGRDEVGLVVFGGSGIVAIPPRDITNDYTDFTAFTPPNNNFKTTGNAKTLIGDIAAKSSNTGTAEALYLAYMTLRADAKTNSDLPTKLNVIVLFTDGLPNGITVFANDPKQSATNKNFMMSSTSGCSDINKGSYSTPLVSGGNTNMIGWFSQHGNFGYDSTGAFGLNQPMMAYAYTGYTGKGDDIDAYMKFTGTEANVGQMANCAGGGTMKGSMAKFPDYDLYGNYTDLSKVPALPSGAKPPLTKTGDPLYKLGDLYSNQCGSNAYDASLTTNSCQIGLASWQATAHQAWKIWNQVIWDKTTQQNIADNGTYLTSPVIFVIGFDHHTSGGEPPDTALMQLVANDANSTVSFSNRIKGQYFRAADANAVDVAFQQIASEILRLSQ